MPVPHRTQAFPLCTYRPSHCAPNRPFGPLCSSLSDPPQSRHAAPDCSAGWCDCRLVGLFCLHLRSLRVREHVAPFVCFRCVSLLRVSQPQVPSHLLGRIDWSLCAATGGSPAVVLALCGVGFTLSTVRRYCVLYMHGALRVGLYARESTAGGGVRPCCTRVRVCCFVVWLLL